MARNDRDVGEERYLLVNVFFPVRIVMAEEVTSLDELFVLLVFQPVYDVRLPVGEDERADCLEGTLVILDVDGMDDTRVPFLLVLEQSHQQEPRRVTNVSPCFNDELWLVVSDKRVVRLSLDEGHTKIVPRRFVVVIPRCTF